MVRTKTFHKINLKENYAELILKNSDKKVLIDLDDIEKIKQYTWHLTKYGYVRENYKRFFLHNLIMGGKGIDHISRDKLDNRKSNLRFCSSQENNCNRTIPNNNTSGCMGVSFQDKKFISYITFKNKRIHLGRFKTFEEAKEVRLDAEQKYYGVKNV